MFGYSCNSCFERKNNDVMIYILIPYNYLSYFVGAVLKVGSIFPLN